VRFLYDLGVRPRKHNGDRVSPLIGLARHGGSQKLRYALSLGYHEPANESARQYTTAMIMAAATDDDMFDYAIGIIGADYYYNIPLWIRLSYLTTNTPRELICRVVSRYTRHNDEFLPTAIQQVVDAFTDKYPILDRVMNTYWDPMYCIIEARTDWSQFQPGRHQVLQDSWQTLVGLVVDATSQENELPYPEGRLSIFSALRTWDCPSLGSSRREGLLSAIKAWLEAAEDCGVDLEAYSKNILDLLDTKLSDDSPWDRQWCHWCQQYGPIEHRGHKLLRLEVSTGPDALAWDLVWDVEVEELVGEFWNLIEKSGSVVPELQMPGAWVE
jgi:hypothetical protein